MKFITTYLWFFFLSVTISFGQTQDIYEENVKAAKAFFQKKEFLMSAQLYSKAFFSNHNLGRIDHRYEAARSWALAGEIDSAFNQLEKISKGHYYQYLEISTDTSFTKLRTDGRWSKLLEIIAKNKIEADERSLSLLKEPKRDVILELDTIYVDDQLYRRQMDEIEQEFGKKSPQMDVQLELIKKHDAVNKEKVKYIINKYGWLGKEEVGDQGNITLFLVIQHSDLTTQLKYMQLLKEAVKQGKANASSFALLQDRVALGQGKNQIYGSQIGFNASTGKYYVQVLDDPENVDKRRAEVGLTPLKDYVAKWGIEWSIEQYYKDIK